MNVLEGFANGNASVRSGYWKDPGTGVVLSATPHVAASGITSGYYLQPSTVQATTYRFADGDRWMHIAIRIPAGLGDVPIVQFNRDGNAQIMLECVGTSRVIRARRGAINSGATIIATGAVAVTENVWHWLWIYLDADTATNGECIVYLDGDSVTPALNTGATNTAASGVAGWDQLGFQANTGGQALLLTDLITYTDAERTAGFGARYPAMYVPGVIPTGNTTVSFVAGGFGQVDEIPWSTADYASSNAASQELICSHSGLPGGLYPRYVHGVAPTWLIERDGNINTSRGRLVVGAANVTGPVTPGIGSAQYTQRQDFYAVNPDGAVEWTWPAVLSSSFGTVTG